MRVEQTRTSAGLEGIERMHGRVGEKKKPVSGHTDPLYGRRRHNFESSAYVAASTASTRSNVIDSSNSIDSKWAVPSSGIRNEAHRYAANRPTNHDQFFFSSLNPHMMRTANRPADLFPSDSHSFRCTSLRAPNQIPFAIVQKFIEFRSVYGLCSACTGKRIAARYCGVARRVKAIVSGPTRNASVCIWFMSASGAIQMRHSSTSLRFHPMNPTDRIAETVRFGIEPASEK